MEQKASPFSSAKRERKAKSVAGQKSVGVLPLSIAQMMFTSFIQAGQLDKAEKLLQSSNLWGETDQLRYELGVVYAQKNKFGQAIEHLRGVLQKHPQDVKTRQATLAILQAQAGYYVAQREWETAVLLLQEAVQLDPQNIKLQHGLSAVQEAIPLIHLSNNEPEKAIAIWEQIQVKELTNYRLAHQLAIVHHRQAIELEEAGQLKAADPHWRKAIANWVVVMQADAFWEIWITRRQTVYGGVAIESKEVADLRQKGLRERLEQIHRDFQMNNPSQTERHKTYRLLLALEQKTAQAMRETAEILTRHHKPVPLPIYAGPEMLTHLKLLSAAKTMATTAQKLDAKAQAPQNLALYLSSLGRLGVLVEEKQTSQAISELKAVLQREPANSTARTLLVLALKQEGEGHAAQNAEEAIATWIEVLTYEPRNQEIKTLIADTCIQKAREFQKTEELDSAIRLLTMALKSVTNHREMQQQLAITLNLRGVQRTRQKLWDSAIADFEEAARLDPQNQQVQKNLAETRKNKQMNVLLPILVHLQMGNYDRGIAEATAVLQRDPGNAEASKLLGQLHQQRAVSRGNQGQWREAVDDLQHALQYQPHNSQFQQDMALACNAYGVELANATLNLPDFDRLGKCRQLGEAERIFQQGLRYLPGDKQLATNLAQVRLGRLGLGC